MEVKFDVQLANSNDWKFVSVQPAIQKKRVIRKKTTNQYLHSFQLSKTILPLSSEENNTTCKDKTDTQEQFPMLLKLINASLEDSDNNNNESNAKNNKNKIADKMSIAFLTQ